MKLKTFLFLLFVSLAGMQNLQAQNATIRGNILDGETGDPMMSATVRIFRDTVLVTGGYSNLDGDFEIPNLSPGTYTITISMSDYATLNIVDVKLKANQVYFDRFVMELDEDEMKDKEVLITAKRNKESQVAVDVIRSKLPAVADVMGSEEISRQGGSDITTAMAKVPAVTIEGGKYLYVRGLGDRYTRTLLNGAAVPGLDPDRNAVQMDLFPSNQVANIMVYKSFTPDLPGDFVGGLVSVTTKDFPEAFTLQYSSTIGYNTQSSFRSDFLSGTRGKTDWLGMDDGTRALPEFMQDRSFIIPTISFTNAEDAAAVDAASKSFNTPIYPSQSNSLFNHQHSFSIGDQKKFLKRPLGVMASLSYNNSYGYYNDGINARWKLTNQVDVAKNLEEQLFFNDVSATREVLWGGLFNLSYQLGQGHKLSFNYIHNQSGSERARYMSGRLPDDDPNLIFETRSVGYQERSMDVFQLVGKHKFEGLGKLQADWLASMTRSKQDEPDLRFFSNDYTIAGEDTLYDIQRNLYNPPSRFFREMEETNADMKLNFELPFSGLYGQASSVKFGGAYTAKSRTFTERRFEFNTNVAYSGDDEAFFADDNLGVIDTLNEVFLYGNYVSEGTERRNTYYGDQSISAVYGMTELPLWPKLKFIGGARFEHTKILVQSADQDLATGNLDLNDILPSASFVFAPSDSVNMNIRAGYSRTLARPTFRELAPYASFEFVRDFVLVGNENLQRTLVDNIDLRWEWFVRPGELLSAGVFYKQFTNPIERVINPTAANTELNYRNVEAATAYGVELEFRKKLDFITPALGNFTASGNLTLIKSFLDINEAELALIRTLNPDAPSQRPMFGQSPYTMNAELSYNSDTLGLQSSLSFNVFGARISNVSIGGTPNVYEQPRPTLHFMLRKTLGDHWALRFRARNLLNPQIRQTHTFKGQEYIYSAYTLGRTFSLGVSYTIK